VQYELNGQMFDALSNDFYYIVPEKCTECVGHFDQEQCAAVCPVDCCVADPNRVETEEVLATRAKALHPGKAFAELGATNSHFRK
jgi:ferredoxin